MGCIYILKDSIQFFEKKKSSLHYNVGWPEYNRRRRRRRRRKQILILSIYVGYVQLYGWRSTGCVNIDKPPGWLSSLRFLFFFFFFFFPPLSDVLFIIISSSVFFFLFFLPLFLMKSRVTWSRPNERMTSYRPTGHDEIEKKTTNSYFMLSLYEILVATTRIMLYE